MAIEQNTEALNKERERLSKEMDRLKAQKNEIEKTIRELENTYNTYGIVQFMEGGYVNRFRLKAKRINHSWRNKGDKWVMLGMAYNKKEMHQYITQLISSLRIVQNKLSDENTDGKTNFLNFDENEDDLDSFSLDVILPDEDDDILDEDEIIFMEDEE